VCDVFERGGFHEALNTPETIHGVQENFPQTAESSQGRQCIDALKLLEEEKLKSRERRNDIYVGQAGDLPKLKVLEIRKAFQCAEILCATEFYVKQPKRGKRPQ